MTPESLLSSWHSCSLPTLLHVPHQQWGVIWVMWPGRRQTNSTPSSTSYENIQAPHGHLLRKKCPWACDTAQGVYGAQEEGIPRSLVWTDNQREGTRSVSHSYSTQHSCSRNLCIYFSNFPLLTSQVNEFVPARVREISLKRPASWRKFLWS